MDQMQEALMKEIILQKNRMQHAGQIDTIYFGGGTPSLFPVSYLHELLNEIAKHYSVTADPEITLEANPDDINQHRLQEWKSIGINRFSLGIQSFDDRVLKGMNRAHTAEEASKSIDLILDAGFNNISADLIFGIPGQNDSILLESAGTLIQKNIPHLSCYALTVEEKTKLHHDIHVNKAQAPDSEQQARQFYLLGDLLKQHGYEQYEISNYALPGFRSRHNSSYWQGVPYLGIGPSAHSFDGKNVRRWNISNNEKYIQLIHQGLPASEQEVLTDVQIANEYIMTSLRRIEGIDLTRLASMICPKQFEKLLREAIRWVDCGWIEKDASSIRLTKAGKIMADGIASGLFLD